MTTCNYCGDNIGMNTPFFMVGRASYHKDCMDEDECKTLCTKTAFQQYFETSLKSKNSKKDLFCAII